MQKKPVKLAKEGDERGSSLSQLFTQDYKSNKFYWYGCN